MYINNHGAPNRSSAESQRWGREKRKLWYSVGRLAPGVFLGLSAGRASKAHRQELPTPNFFLPAHKKKAPFRTLRAGCKTGTRQPAAWRRH